MRELWIGCIVFEDNFRTRDGAIDMKEVASKIGPSKIQGVSWRASTNMAMITLAISSPRSVELCRGHKRCKPMWILETSIDTKTTCSGTTEVESMGMKKDQEKGTEPVYNCFIRLEISRMDPKDHLLWFVHRNNVSQSWYSRTIHWHHWLNFVDIKRKLCCGILRNRTAGRRNFKRRPFQILAKR